MRKLLVFIACIVSVNVMADLFDLVEHHMTDNDGVAIHYVAVGPQNAPLVVMIHGFPDYWYTWREQMDALRSDYRVVALDLRGYNRSAKPEGVENYTLEKLGSDVAAVVNAQEQPSATVVGHDWGGAVAWSIAMNMPEIVENLIILNLPHPRGLARELANSEAQQRASQYAFNFQQPDAHKTLTPERLVGISQSLSEDKVKSRYLEAFRRSNIEAMLNYYKANYPTPGEEFMPEYPTVDVPVLMFHGLQDRALLPGALNDTWQWVSSSLTLVTLPNANHWVQYDAADEVNQVMTDWLRRRYP